jgi:hypothetical protein
MKPNFLIQHEEKVFLVRPGRMTGIVTVEDTAATWSFIDSDDRIVQYGAVTDLRGFSGMISLSDIVAVVERIRSIRLRLGLDPILDQPRSIIRDPGPTAEGFIHLLTKDQARIDLLKVTTDPKVAWNHASRGLPMPPAVRNFLSA